MKTSWPIRLVRALFFAFSVFIGMAIAVGLQQEAWTGAVSGAAFMGLLLLLDSIFAHFTLRDFSHATLGLAVGLFCAWLITRIGVFQLAYFQNHADGVMIQNIVDRAKKMAIKDFLDTGQRGLVLVDTDEQLRRAVVHAQRPARSVARGADRQVGPAREQLSQPVHRLARRARHGRGGDQSFCRDAGRDDPGRRDLDRAGDQSRRRGAGRIFHNQVALSGKVPQVCCLFGPSAAGGAWASWSGGWRGWRISTGWRG